MRWVAIAGYLALIVVIVIVIVLLLFMREISRPGEATAEYFHSRTLVYSSINLRPGLGQINNARGVGDLLRTDEVIDQEDDLMDDLEDETGIHLLDDVASWLGTDITFALLDIHEDVDLNEWVLMAQVRDREKALGFVEKLRDYLEDDLDTDTDREDIGGVDIWIADDESLVIGLSDDYVLY